MLERQRSTYMDRLGAGAKGLGFCIGDQNCPDVLDMGDGRIAIIGADITTTHQERLPDDAGCGHDERMVMVPQEVWESAVQDYLRRREP